MKKQLYTLSLVFATLVSYGQDVIVKKNVENLKVVVTEISATTLLYKSFDNQQGNTSSINKNDIFIVVFKNGLKLKYKGNTEDISTSGVTQPLTSTTIEPDIIVLKTGQEIKGVVKSIEDTKTLYQRLDFPFLPVHSIPKSDILEIKYSKKPIIQETQNKSDSLPNGDTKQENKTSIIVPKANNFTSKIEYMKGGFWQNGQVLSSNQAEEILKTNQKSFDFYNQGKQSKTTYSVLAVLAVSSVGTALFLVPKDKYGLQIGVGVAGLAFSIAGFAVQSNVKYKFAQAASAYNSGNGTAFSKTETYYGITNDGQLAIGLKF